MSENKMMVDAVFEGGGVKGIGLVGAAAVIEERGYQWSNLAGTSAGAIVAALLAAGYTSLELKNIMMQLDYNNFKDTELLDRIKYIGPLASLIFQKGIYEGKFLENWLRDLLKAKNKDTFGKLIIKEFEDDDRYKFKLRVIASDISRGRMLALPQDIRDYGIKPEELDVASAVRMSMSIPFFYEPVKLKYKKEDGKEEDTYIVDGGVLSNFPVWLFDSQGVPEWPTFGFKLVEPEEKEEVRHQISGPITLLTGLFSTMMEAQDARYISSSQYVRTIPIPTLGVGTTEFGITQERSEALYESGRKAADNFLKSWDFQRYIEGFRKGKQLPSRGELLRRGII
jgi:NTE family protein